MDDLGPRAPRYVLNGGYPLLQFGRGDTGGAAILSYEWKPQFRKAGLVAVIGGDDLPPKRVEADPGRFVEVPALTDDPAVVALMERFRRDLDAGTWRPGPVADEPVALDAVREYLGIRPPPGG